MISTFDFELVAPMLPWFAKTKSISQAWAFGSRVRGNANLESDLDIALLLEPDDGEVLAEWISNAEEWRCELRGLYLAGPIIDLQLVFPEHDEIVWPAVLDHGVLIFDRALT